jgi:hypothetical protein
VQDRRQSNRAAPTVKVGPMTQSRSGPERLADSKGDTGFKGGARPDDPGHGDKSSRSRGTGSLLACAMPAAKAPNSPAGTCSLKLG